MFAQLSKAIALEVGFNVLNPECKGRFDWTYYEQHEVLANSRIAAAQGVMTSDLFADAFRIKLDGHFRAATARPGYVLVYDGSGVEVRSSFSTIKTRYIQRKAAERAAERLTGADGVKAVTMARYVAGARGVIRKNMQSGIWYVEALGTPAYLSPSCESYWSM